MSSANAILVEQIDAVLPQTQCGKCGHGGCLPYAAAIADGEAINKCPPGGDTTLHTLAQLLQRPLEALEQPAEAPQLAVIREDECIGCTKCIQACPVDAIVGAAKQMHGVLEAECTGCELCVEPCPVDCIDIIAHPQWQAAHDELARQRYLNARAANGRARHRARNARLEARKAALTDKRMARLKQRLSPAKADSRAVTSTTGTPADGSPTVSTTGATASAATSSSSRNSALIARLQHKLSRLAAEDPKRHELEQRLSDLQQSTHAVPQQTRQLKMALAAAEQRRRLAERHLQHCYRQAGPDEIDAAKQALEQARSTEQAARAALEQSPSLD
ncbi:Ion-translocating oxidoreductase complex subunit B [Carnimonas sp. R-84981]|uniref:RnfABCDGE type electron transport complex subunit B n=1 Tax=Carnimonas bestiolae TaxID=3402172 RepID=UPI003EDBE820